MPDPNEVTKPDYLTCLRGLERLHEFYLIGESDGPEADRIRDSMDAPWFKLTDQERQSLDDLSERLYAEAEGGAKNGPPPSEPHMLDPAPIPS